MTMETYAERLQKRKEEKMSNYDIDEIERERDRNAFASVKIGEPKKATTEVEIELSDDDLLIFEVLFGVRIYIQNFLSRPLKQYHTFYSM